MNNFSLTLLTIGLVFIGLSTIGLHRFDTIYNRIHAATLSTTFGTIFVVASILVYSVFNYETGLEGIANQTLVLHSLVALGAIILTNAVSAHAIAKSAHGSGYSPKSEIDMLKEEGVGDE